MKRFFCPLPLLCAIAVAAAAAPDNTRLNTLMNEGVRHAKNHQYLDAARKFEEGLRDAEGSSAGAFLRHLGDAYQKLGRYKDAIFCFSESLRQAEETREKRKVVADLMSLGAVSILMDNQLKAISFYSDALRITRSSGLRYDTAAALLSLGDAYRGLGFRRKAQAHYEDALAHFRRLGSQKEIAGTLVRIGALYAQSGDDAAADRFAGAGKIARKLGAWRILADILEGQGDLEGKRGNYGEALSCYLQARERHEEAKNATGAAGIELRMGQLYFRAGDFPAALSALERAAAIARSAGHRELSGRSLFLAGNVQERLGDVSKSLDCYADALAVKREAGLPTVAVEERIADLSLARGDSMAAEERFRALKDDIGLGRVFLARRNYRKAITFFNRALRDTLDNRDTAALFAIYTGLGHAWLYSGNYQKAAEQYVKAVAVFEDEKGLFFSEMAETGTENVRGFSLAEPYEGAVRALVSRGSPDEAFFYSEALKMARFALLAEMGGTVRDAAPLPPEVAKEERSVLGKTIALKKELQASVRLKIAESSRGIESELAALKARHARLVSRIQSIAPAYAAVRYYRPLKPGEVPLREDEVLLSFEATGENLYLFILTGANKKVSVRNIPLSRRELRETVAEYRNLIDGTVRDEAARRTAARNAKRLAATLFAGWFDSFPDAGRVTIVPDESLERLPFASLSLGESTAVGTIYLGERYSLSFAPAATAKSLPGQETAEDSAGKKLLVVVDPDFPVAGERAKKAPGERREQTVADLLRAWNASVDTTPTDEATGDDTPRLLFPRLDNAAPVDTAAGVVFGTHAVILSGSRADEENFRRFARSRNGHMLMATYAVFDRLPYLGQPAVVLASGGPGGKHDGFLTVSELIHMKLPSGAVVLPYGRETGRSDASGIFALARALQQAGCGDVILSLWQVPDEVIALFTGTLFRALEEGESARDAFRSAQDQLGKNGYDDPFHWSGFVLVAR